MTTKLKERPVVFTAEEVNAVLAGNKTQHRMVIKNTKDTQCLFSGDWRYDGRDFLDSDGFTIDPRGAHYVERLEPSEGEERQYTEDYRCVGHYPLGRVGDRLWVQEPTLAIEDVGWIGPVFVASDDGRNAIDWGYGPYDDPAHIPACELTYNNPCDLSYEDSRILLEITDIRIERVQDTSHADAVAEGVHHFDIYARLRDQPLSVAQIVFSRYWDTRHQDGFENWESNPWVWVIEFKKVDE